MPEKKHAPIKELRQAKKEADEILKKKGFIAKDSAIDRINQTEGKPILPGIPASLPYPDVITTTKRALYDIAREWQLITKNEPKKQADGIQFFKFVVHAMSREESRVSGLIKGTVKDKIFSLKTLHERRAVQAVKKLLVDSFAISVIVKSNTDTAAYLLWFNDWSDSLLKEWGNRAKSAVGYVDKEKSRIHTP